MRRLRTTRARRAGRGFTLVETLIAAIVLATASAAISLAIAAAAGQGDYALHAQQASELGDELIERVLALPYADPQGGASPGPEIGETGPTLFNNADDYHGYSEPAGQVKDASGSLYPAEYQVFTRSVTAAYVNQSISGLGTITGLRVTVTVQDSVGDAWTLTRLIPQPQ